MGYFIAFEGIDGAGKTTQIAAARDVLSRHNCEVTCCTDPGSTPLGAKIRHLVLGLHGTEIGNAAEMLLFMAARAQLVDEIIAPAKERGQWVLCDRFILSTVVYQAHAGTLDPQNVWQIGKLTSRGLLPDLTILLDLPVEIAWKRLGEKRDRIESRGPDYLKKVRQGFLTEAKKLGDRALIVDATCPPEVVAKRIGEALQKMIVVGA